MKSVPKEAFKKLQFQEECLKKREGLALINADVIKYICKKTKKNEEELLMNKSSEMRIKNEMKEMVDHKQKSNQSGRYHWVLSLRRKRFDISEKQKISYVNIGSNNRPLWTMVNENKHKELEFVRSPFNKTNLPKIDVISNKKYFMNSGIDFRKLDDYSSLKLEGRNLLEEEMKVIKAMKGKKFLQKKDDELNDAEKIEYYNTCNTLSTKKAISNDTSFYFNTSIK